MALDDGEIRLEPTTLHVDDLLDEVDKGRLRVPEFQRPFVWRPDQMIALFESIERGYPIGSLLLWQTDQPVPTLTHIAGIELPEAPPGTQISYVLDGHQRLSTLFGVLRRRTLQPRPDDPREWKWWIYRDLRQDTRPDDWYRHYSRSLPVAHFLPLRAASRTLDFLQFSRMLEARSRGDLAEMIRIAEGVAQRIKAYKVPLIRLGGASLSQAVEVYTRLNRQGMRMEADQMVSALTYQRPGRTPLANQVDDIVTAVATSARFGRIPRQAVFRTVLAVAGESDIMSPRWEAVAERLQDRLHGAVPATESAIRRAVEFLQVDVQLPLAALLPYAHQLTVLAAFCHYCPEPTEPQRRELRRWFWVTSWASSFAGATSTTLRRALQEMQDFAHDKGTPTLNVGDIRPMPDQFNLNSARTRAYMVWELQEMPRRRDGLGQEFDPVDQIRSVGTQAYQRVVPRDSRPANRLIMPLVPKQTVLGTLRELEPAQRAILDSHGIPVKAWHRLREGRHELFVHDRTEYLTQRLRVFAQALDIPLGDELEGVADDDTE